MNEGEELRETCNFMESIARIKISLEKFAGKARAISEKIYFWIRRSAHFTRIVIFPTAKTVFIAGALLCSIIFVGYLTLCGLRYPLTNEYESLFGTLTQTVGTIVAIFFSLILIPLNQIATKYSPKFLNFLKRDNFFVFILIFSGASLIYDVVFLFYGASYLITIAGVFLFALLIVLLGFFIFHIIKLSDPYNSILIPSHDEIVGNLRKQIPRYHKICEANIAKAFSGNKQLAKENFNLCYLKVDDKVIKHVQEDLLPIREVAIKAIKEFDLEQSKNSVQIIMSIIVHYLYARRNYYSDDDPLLYSVYSEYKIIVQAGNNELKIKLHEFIVECWRRIGLQAAKVNVKILPRIQDNLNNLVAWPVKGLVDLSMINLSEMDSYAPGKACEALGDIGAMLMAEGYDHQAAIVIQELEKISLIAEVAGAKHVSGSANYAIMRVYVNGVAHRNIGGNDEFNYSYRTINTSIRNLLRTFLTKPKSVYDNMILSPLIGSLVDPMKGLNISKVSEYGIFSPDLNEFSITMNIECVRSNIQILRESLGLLATKEEHYYSDQIIENLYHITLNLLSYVNEQMAKDHILFYQKHPIITGDIREIVGGIIMEGFEVLIELVLKRADRYLFQKDHLDVLFSLYLIILYENKFRPNEELSELFNDVHQSFQDMLIRYKTLPDSDCNDATYKYFRLLVAILNASDAVASLAKDFDVPEYEYRSRTEFSIAHESIYPRAMFDGQWIIKRPGFQVNTYYYNNIETSLKLDTLKFY